ncbi:MAG: FHA domain-containing protein [Planctomycetes bacterium]|nr:FHA domain-containing protein [Planctomycetota bacterium]
MAQALFPALYIRSEERFHPLPEGFASITVGRDPDADVRISEATFSRRQFLLRRSGSTIWVENLSEKNPTRRNGAPLAQPVPIEHGDLLEAGKVALAFLEHADPTALGIRTAPRPAPADRASEAEEGEERTLVGQGGGRADTRGVEGDHVLPPAPFIIGRAAERSSLCLRHPQVSRVHARIQPAPEGGHTIADLHSANGTFVNGEKVARPRRLRRGDRILIGPYALTYTGISLSVGSTIDNLTLSLIELTREVRDRQTGRRIRILDEVNVVARPGDFVCILGPSGSGKSTLMNAASGRVPSTSGSVRLNGLDLYANFDGLKRSLAYVPQKEALHRLLTVDEALRYSASLRLPPDVSADEIDESIAGILDMLGLEGRRGTRIADLSGGQLRRMSLANEIISRPSLLFLDEVTSGLDELTDREVMEAIARLSGAGKTILCITHNLTNIETSGGQVLLLTAGGKLAFYGSPAEALGYFGVARLGDLYGRLSEKPAAAWQEAFRQSPLYDRHIGDLLPSDPRPVEPEPAERPRAEAVEVRASARRQFVRQAGILLARYARLFARDGRSLALLFGQPIVVGLLIAILFGSLDRFSPLEKPQQIENLLFLLSIACIWFGCNNAAKEIVKERTIYLQERDASLRIDSYFASKAILLAGVCLLQAQLIYWILRAICRVPGPWPIQAATAWAGAGAGMLMGLLVSSLSSTTDVAVSTVPIVLIPQVIFTGVIVRLEGIAKIIAWALVPNYWCFQAFKATVPESARGARIRLPGRTLQEMGGDEPRSIFISFAVLLAMAVVLGGLTVLRLRAGDRRFRR